MNNFRPKHFLFYEDFRVVLSTMYARLHVKHPLYCQILMKLLFSRLSKNTQMSNIL